MKTSIRNKKGFTIVELVIVIAVIAILAAVLIPTFANLVEKANQSADIQACRQMNTQLAIANAESPIDDIGDAIIALDKANIDLENYKPVTADHYFYYVNDKNGTPTVIYTDAEDKVLYPEGFDTTGLQLMTLSGEIPTDDGYTIGNDGAVTITSGAQLAHLMQNRNPEQELTITLDGDIDLKGCTAGFGEVTKSITLQGKDGSSVALKGIREDTNAINSTFAGTKKEHGFAMFGYVKQDITVTVKNVNISNVVVRNTGDIQFGMSAVLFGKVDGDVVIENVTIDSCAVYGGDKAGSVIGYIGDQGSAQLKNVKVTNTEVYGAGFTAKVAGFLCTLATISFDDDCNFDGVTTGINRDLKAFNPVWTSGTKRDTNWDHSDLTPDDTYVISDSDNVTITGSYIDTNKTYTFKKENYNAKGNSYICWIKSNGDKTTSGAYTNDYYWVDFTNTKVTINNQETYIHLSSSKNKASGDTTVTTTNS